LFFDDDLLASVDSLGSRCSRSCGFSVLFALLTRADLDPDALPWSRVGRFLFCPPSDLRDCVRCISFELMLWLLEASIWAVLFLLLPPMDCADLMGFIDLLECFEFNVLEDFDTLLEGLDDIALPLCEPFLDGLLAPPPPPPTPPRTDAFLTGFAAPLPATVDLFCFDDILLWMTRY
jgi:hypothetical protein